MQLLLAITLVASVHFAAQSFMPALPAMASYYDLSSADMVQVVLLYFFGFGLSHLFFAPWLEASGGRKVFFSGLLLFSIGCFLSYFSPSSEFLACGRLLQGLGAGAPMILSRAVLKNAFEGERLTKALRSLSAASALALIAAPFVGSWSTTLFGWQLSFLLLGIYVLSVMAFGVVLQPFKVGPASKMPFRSVAGDYVRLMSNRHFWCIGMFKWVPTLLMLSFVTYLPWYMQGVYGLSEAQYGLYMMLPFCGAMLGTIIAGLLNRRFSVRTGIVLLWPLPLAGSILLLYYPNSMYATLAAVSLFMVAAGAYYPYSLQLLLKRFKYKSEMADALLWAIDMLVVSCIAMAINRYLLTELEDLGGLFTLGSMMVLVSWLVLHNDASANSDEKRLMKIINS